MIFIYTIIQGSYIAKDCNAASSLFIYKNSNQNIKPAFRRWYVGFSSGGCSSSRGFLND
jgi:hypothetical protein